jgi:hypothetical protein
MIGMESRRHISSRQRWRPYHRMLFAPMVIAAAADVLAGL